MPETSPPPPAGLDAPVADIGGGAVGVAIALALARRGAAPVLLEAEPALALAASGTNSGILHTGFDSTPGELETAMILRAAALRDDVLDTLGVPILRCGAVLRPRTPEDGETVRALAENAARNGVEAMIGEDGGLHVPGESVTDPVAYVHALAGAARRAGADLRTGARVTAIERSPGGLSVRTDGGDAIRVRVVVNAAGLHADAIARMAGDGGFGIYPRKGEFFVFDAPPPDRILLPVPTKRTKGVLVFPTLDGRVVAGPTAVDGEDKDDWSVRPAAREEIAGKAAAMYAALDGLEPVASYAGLRPAGREGANYVIGPSTGCPGLVHVAAIRSTGLTASLGIAEHVSGLVAEQGVALGEPEALDPGPHDPDASPAPAWWQRTARHHART